MRNQLACRIIETIKIPRVMKIKQLTVTEVMMGYGN